MFKIDEKKVFWRENDEEVVLLNVESGDYYSLNPVGAFIWKMIAAGIDETQMLESIVTEYEIDPVLARRDLKDIIKTFQKEHFFKDN